MKTFDELWKFIATRRGVITVQEYHELSHVFNLMRTCESYLEVGSAEGNSMYILTQAMKPGANVTYIDWAEKHTTPPRDEVIGLLEKEGYNITGIHGDTTDYNTVARVVGKFDCVLIDAGHSCEEALSDAENYGRLAKKYVIFHDVCLPEVNRAFEEYSAGKKSYKMINSTTFGYGVIEVAQ